MQVINELDATLATVIVLIGAALLHASFQLSVSVMTLLSGHSLGRKRSHGRLLHLCASYIGGHITITVLLLFAAHYILSSLQAAHSTLWGALAAVGAITGLGALLFYRRKKEGQLWVPQGAAQYLYERSKKTKRGFEAFGLGMLAGITELPFIAASLLLAAMTLYGSPDATGISAALSYAALASLPLLVVFVLIGSGKRVSQLEQWREKNRGFLQFVSGAGLLALSLFVFMTFYSVSGGSA